MNTETPLVNLGKTDIEIPPLGAGTWQWGDRTLWGYGRGYGSSDAEAAYLASIEAGITFIDTAEVYGSGLSERLLGQFLTNTSDRALNVATKFMPFPWRWGKGALLRALRNSLKRLNLKRVDLYQIHWPFPPISVETWAEALAEAVQQGLTRAVGVSNYNESQMRRAYSTLAKHGIPLASNQVSYSLIDRAVEYNGLLAACKELEITLIAYSPLGKGALTGKYSPDRLPPGLRARRYNRALFEKIEPLIRKMRQLGRDHGEKTIPQVALNWLICKGTIPIAGAKNARQARDNAGALGWTLNEDEVAVLDDLSKRVLED